MDEDQKKPQAEETDAVQPENELTVNPNEPVEENNVSETSTTVETTTTVEVTKTVETVKVTETTKTAAEPEETPSGEKTAEPAKSEPAAETKKPDDKKKWILIAILAVIVVLLAVIAVVKTSGDKKAAAAAEAAVETTAAAADEAAEEETAAELPQLDFDALTALHDEDDVIMTVDGADVTWDEYIYWLSYDMDYINYYCQLYGQSYTLDQLTSSTDTQTYADYIIAVTESYIKQMHSIQNYLAVDNKLTLSDESKVVLEEENQENMAAACGENATEEDFEAYLAQMQMTRHVYDFINELNQLYVQGQADLYGIGGSDVSDEEVVSWLDGQGYMYAAHILWRNTDSSTGDALDDETLAARQKEAAAIADELQKITGNTERLSKFYEYMNDKTEDAGVSMYGDGYLFQEGDMVTEFEDAVKALNEYEVSAPVESDYGYHVIIRLPLSADAVIEYDDDGNAVTAREEYAETMYNTAIGNKITSAAVEYVNGFTAPNLLDYVK